MISRTTSAKPFFTLDISRLLSRANAPVPTGIDRVEFEYAQYLLATAPRRLEFAAMHPLGRFASISSSIAADFIAAIGESWDIGSGDSSRVKKLASRLRNSIISPRLSIKKQKNTHHHTRVYLLLSHHHLTRPSVVSSAINRRENTLFVPMIHDLIPLEYPEYSRPREKEYHQRRITTVVESADAVLTPSEAVKASLTRYFKNMNRQEVPIWSIPHGVHLQALKEQKDYQIVNYRIPDKPYFVFLSTIEARKNHLLLLNIWRQLVTTHGDNAPKLIIVGKRGWENEQVLDMLERCPSLQGVVEEHNALPDTHVVELLRGARALLFPSFTEGFGLPLAEALALGTPVICSDIPVFREIGGAAAHYISPLDGLGWMERIEQFTQMTNYEARAANRTHARQCLNWNESITQAIGKIESLAKEKHPKHPHDH